MLQLQVLPLQTYIFPRTPETDYHDGDVGNDFDEDEFAPENVEWNVDRILTHGSAHHDWTVRLGISLQKK